MDPMIERIGVEDRLFHLVNQFHDLTESLREGPARMEMRFSGHGLAHVRPAQFEFLCGFLGGRHCDHEHHGHMKRASFAPLSRSAPGMPTTRLR